jgi:hypothetical protein
MPDAVIFGRWNRSAFAGSVAARADMFLDGSIPMQPS